MLYTVLNTDGSCCWHNGQSKRSWWALPVKNDDGTWTPGKWTPTVKGEPGLCRGGYHLYREDDLLGRLGPMICEAEYRGKRLDVANGIVVRKARLLCIMEAWNERTARLFACDCAERVLPFWHDYDPDDKRPDEAIAVARRYARGQADRAELAIAHDAAHDATIAAWAAWYADLDAANAPDATEPVPAWISTTVWPNATTWAPVVWSAVAARNAAADAWPITISVPNAVAGAIRDFYAGIVEHKWQQQRLMAYLCGEVQADTGKG